MRNKKRKKEKQIGTILFVTRISLKQIGTFLFVKGTSLKQKGMSLFVSRMFLECFSNKGEMLWIKHKKQQSH